MLKKICKNGKDEKETNSKVEKMVRKKMVQTGMKKVSADAMQGLLAEIV